LKLVEPPEKFPRNLDSLQVLTGGDGVRNPFEVYQPKVQFHQNQSLHDIVVKRQSLHNLFCDRYGFSSIMGFMTGISRFVGVAMASVHRHGLFSGCTISRSMLHCF
jgi:hypothetical protein